MQRCPKMSRSCPEMSRNVPKCPTRICYAFIRQGKQAGEKASPARLPTERRDELSDFTPLKGLRREMTREMFEDLCALQCEVPEILGYVGTTEEKLERWCRRSYRLPLADAMFMLRQDGLIEIRRAGFDQLKKSATLIQQQFNRFLAAGDRSGKQAESLAKEIFSLAEPSEEEIRDLFGGGEKEG